MHIQRKIYMLRYIYIYTYTHRYIQIHGYTYTKILYIDIHTDIYIYTQPYRYIHINTDIYIYTQICVCLYKRIFGNRMLIVKYIFVCFHILLIILSLFVYSYMCVQTQTHAHCTCSTYWNPCRKVRIFRIWFFPSTCGSWELSC